MNKSYIKHFFFLFIVIVFASCDDDFNEVGANVVGDDNYLGERETYDVNAFNVALGAADSRNLPVAPLGIYNNPVFGKTKAHFATQVVLDASNPVIVSSLNPTVKSVILRIPYFNTLLSTTDGVSTYELDSISGDASSRKIKLDIYESKYYLRDLDPVLGVAQSYFTDQNADFAASMVNPLNDDSDVKQNSEFFFDETAKTVTTTDADGVVTTTNVAPEMQINLNTAFFNEKLFGASAEGQLINDNTFKNYFRGLYFHVDDSGADAGQMAMLNFAGGTITVNYEQEISDSDPNKVQKALTLNLGGIAVNSVSLPETINTPQYDTALANASQVNGDDRLFVRGGGQSSMAVIELFKNKAELEDLRAKNWLVNDASLTFYVDNQIMNQGSAVESQRIFLYDLNNKRTLIDYNVDVTVNSVNTKRNKVVHGGIIFDKDVDKRGTKYKVRITNYLQTLLRYSDSTNVRLGLVVTENINVVTNKKLRTPKTIQQNGDLNPFTIKEIPLMSVAHQFGTVLYGNTQNVPEDKKLKLTVYYTKPN